MQAAPISTYDKPRHAETCLQVAELPRKCTIYQHEASFATEFSFEDHSSCGPYNYSAFFSGEGRKFGIPALSDRGTIYCKWEGKSLRSVPDMKVTLYCCGCPINILSYRGHSMTQRDDRNLHSENGASSFEPQELGSPWELSWPQPTSVAPLSQCN